MTQRETDQPTGSPQGEPVFLAVGKLGRPHGIRGEVFLILMTDFPERLQSNVQVYLGEEYEPLVIRSRRENKDALLLKFDGYDTPEAVGELRNKLLFVRADDRPPLPEGEYYHHQIIGLQAVDEQGDLLGRVTDIIFTGSNDVYIVQPESGPEILLPATEEVILAIDLEQGLIRVHLIPGLLRGE
ncbi:MAG TPA: ribosome maturation factor RimM [Anaerolineales bacterium]|nr:ribosome maturation factor RimM [Anaerolineales bacterium]